tara:strand:+ start:6521 stop:6856 length:336 start_codon:yes stop_codon:yes gene_type:complete
MSINLANNAFFSTEDFAVICRWTVATTSDTYQVKAVFDNQFFEAFDEFGSPVSTSSPVIYMKTDDLPTGHDENDTLIVPITSNDVTSDTTYKVKVIESDGLGVSTIRLQKQ